MRKTVLAALLALLMSGGNALAENYPSHPITLVVPFSAGGPTDSMARIMADRMKTALGQSLLIENVTGAGGSIGVGRVARAAPDGYTVSIGHLGTHVANGAIYKLGYDLVADFEPVVLLPSNSHLIAARKTLPAGDLSALVAWLRANQDKVSMATVRDASSFSATAAVVASWPSGVTMISESGAGVPPVSMVTAVSIFAISRNTSSRACADERLTHTRRGSAVGAGASPGICCLPSTYL